MIYRPSRIRRGPWFPWIPLYFEIYFQGLETPWKKLFLLQCPWIPLKTWEASDVLQCIVLKYLFVLNFPNWWCSDYLWWRAVFVSTKTRAFPCWWKIYSLGGDTVSFYNWYTLYSLSGAAFDRECAWARGRPFLVANVSGATAECVFHSLLDVQYQLQSVSPQ